MPNLRFVVAVLTLSVCPALLAQNDPREPVKPQEMESPKQEPAKPQGEQSSQSASADAWSESQLRALYSQLAKSLEEVSAQKGQLQEQVKELQADLVTASAEIANLKRTAQINQDKLKKYEKITKTDIQFRDRFWTDRSAVFSFHTDQEVRLRGRLYQKSDARSPVKEFLEERPKSDHVISFEGLQYGLEYRLEVIVLGQSGEDTQSRKDYTDINALGIKLEEKNDAPTVTMIDQKSLNPSSIDLEVEINKPSHLEVSCLQLIPGTRNTTPCPTPIYQRIEFDNLGRPLGRLYQAGRNTLRLENLPDGQEYELIAVAYDQLGLKSARPSRVPSYKTSKKPDPVDFVGPLRLEFRPDMIQVSGRFQGEVTRAEFTIEFSGVGSFTLTPESTRLDPQKKEFVLEAPVNKLISALEQHDKDMQPKSSIFGRATEKPKSPETRELPSIKIILLGDNVSDHAERSFVVGFVVPKDSESATRFKLDSDQKGALKAFLDGVGSSKGEKITWESLVRLGIPLIMSFI